MCLEIAKLEKQHLLVCFFPQGLGVSDLLLITDSSILYPLQSKVDLCHCAEHSIFYNRKQQQ